MYLDKIASIFQCAKFCICVVAFTFVSTLLGRFMDTKTMVTNTSVLIILKLLQKHKTNVCVLFFFIFNHYCYVYMIILWIVDCGSVFVRCYICVLAAEYVHFDI